MQNIATHCPIKSCSTQVRVIKEVENKLDTEKAHFDLLFAENDKLTVLNMREKKKEKKYYLQKFDKTA